MSPKTFEELKVPPAKKVESAGVGLDVGNMRAGNGYGHGDKHGDRHGDIDMEVRIEMRQNDDRAGRGPEKT